MSEWRLRPWVGTSTRYVFARCEAGDCDSCAGAYRTTSCSHHCHAEALARLEAAEAAPAIDPELIPDALAAVHADMREELGRFSGLLVALQRRAFWRLGEYSASIPTGVILGKVWRMRRPDWAPERLARWYIRWYYDDGTPGMMAIGTERVFPGEPPADYGRRDPYDLPSRSLTEYAYHALLQNRAGRYHEENVERWAEDDAWFALTGQDGIGVSGGLFVGD